MQSDTIHLYVGEGYRRQLIGHYSQRNTALLTRNYQFSEPQRPGTGRPNQAHRLRYEALLAYAQENDSELYAWIKEDEPESEDD